MVYCFVVKGFIIIMFDLWGVGGFIGKLILIGIVEV